MRANRFIAAAAALFIAVLPARSDQLLPQGRIIGSDPANGDILFGALKLGKRQGGKTLLQPDAIQIQGSGSTGDVSGTSVTLPNGTSLTLPNAFRPIAESARTFPTTSAATALDLSGETQVIITRRSPGDRARPSLYSKKAAKPAHNAYFQDKIENYFVYDETVISVYAMGARGMFSQDDRAAFQLAADVAAARGGGVIDARGDKFIVSGEVNLTGGGTHLLTYGSQVASTSTTADILHFKPSTSGADDLVQVVSVRGGDFVYTSGDVTSGSAINFDRVGFGNISDVKTYGAFYGVTVASSLNTTIHNANTDNGSNWTALKPGSAGLRVTRSPGSNHHNSVIDVTDSFITGNNLKHYTEFAVLLQEVDGFRSTNSYFSFADKNIGLIPYDVDAPLSLIEFSNSGLDTPTKYQIYAPAMAGYKGNYVDNSFVGGYMFNAGPQIALLALQSTNVQNPWDFRALKASRSKGDGFVVSGAGRYTFDGITFRDMALGGGATSTCIRLQNATSVLINAVDYAADDSDANFANSLVSMEGTTDNVSITSWKWKGRNSGVPPILRAATAGPNMTISKGQSQESNTFGPEHIVSSQLSIPASLSYVQMYASGTISGVDAASTWRDRVVTIVFLSGASLTSSSSFVLKGGSRTAATNDVLKLWYDGAVWREI